MDSVSGWLLYRGMRHALGLWSSKKLRHEFRRWQGHNRWPRHCSICGEHMTRSQRSLDHVIPISICYELGLPGLVYDQRNFAIAHRECNTARGDSIAALPKGLRERLEYLRTNNAVPEAPSD